MSQKQWTTTVKENRDGELYIDIPEEILKELGWNETTELEWDISSDRITLKRSQE